MMQSEPAPTGVDMGERLEAGKEKPKTKHFGDGVYYEKFFPSTALPTTHHSRPLIFTIPAVKGCFIDLSLMKMYLKIRVRRTDGSKMKDDDIVFPKSAPLYTLFKDLEVSFNNTTVFTSRGMYPWYANLYVQLKADNNIAVDTVWYFDDSFDLDPVYRKQKDPKGKDRNVLTGYSGRNIIPEWGTRGGAFQSELYQELMGNVLFDLCFQSKFLRDDIDMRLIFTPCPSQLSLFASDKEDAGDKYYVEIDTAYIVAPRFKLKPRYSLPKGRLQYFYVDNILTVHMIAKGVQNVNKQLSSGSVPRRVGFFFVSEDAYLGDTRKSPFSYKDYGMVSFQLTIGDKRYPTDPLKADFDEGKYGEVYMYFLDQIRSYGVLGNGKMSLEKYGSNHMFVFFDLTDDMSAGSGYHVQQEDGVLAVAISFKAPLPENVVMVQVSEYDRSLEISRSSQVSVGEAGGVSA